MKLLKLRLFLIALLLPTIWLGAACSDSDNNAPASTATAVVEAQVKGTVAIDFTDTGSQRPKTNAPFAVQPGTKAIDAIKDAVGGTNVGTKDFGGDLGIFITGFYGVEAAGNNFWEFSVNGKSSDEGVSKYEVKDGDSLEFKYSSF